MSSKQKNIPLAYLIEESSLSIAAINFFSAKPERALVHYCRQSEVEMAPQRFRGLQEDSRSESSNAREKHPMVTQSGVSKVRRYPTMNSGPSSGSNLKDVTAAPTLKNGSDGSDSIEKIQWSSFDATFLNAYRQSHRLDTPPAFSSAYSQYILTCPGIAASSPTMALHKDRRRASKDQLALAVRKDFNAAMVSESDSITSFLYTIQNEDKNFRMRFPPSRSK